MVITHKHIDDIFEYDGSQINASWAFKEFNIYGSSIITWVGPVNITEDNLKDFEDVGLEIKSDKMVNFICEFFDCQPANMKIAYLRQRLLVLIFKECLLDKGIGSVRKGDDIYVDGRKLSISIATASLSSMKIHFAVNIEDKGTPCDVDTIGLFDIDNRIFNLDTLNDFIFNVVERFIDAIEKDISKTNLL